MRRLTSESTKCKNPNLSDSLLLNTPAYRSQTSTYVQTVDMFWKIFRFLPIFPLPPTNGLSISLPLLQTKLAKRRIISELFGATIPDRPGFHGGLERNASNPTCSLPLPGRHRWTSALTGQGRQRPRESHNDFIKNEANCTDI